MCAKMGAESKRAAKLALFKRDGNRCWICERELSYGSATLDHVIPRSHPRGTNRHGNLKLACEPCNRLRGDRIMGPGLMAAIKRDSLAEAMTVVVIAARAVRTYCYPRSETSFSALAEQLQGMVG